MYGDTDVLRRHVDRLREQADDIRKLADQLVASTETTGWSGRAAESMTQRVGERAVKLRAAAAEHETAADTLGKHVAEVDRLKDQIDAIEQRATTLVADARTRVSRITAQNAESEVSVEPDPDDLTLTAFDPPPPGHRDWLAVELPGL